MHQDPCPPRTGHWQYTRFDLRANSPLAALHKRPVFERPARPTDRPESGRNVGDLGQLLDHLEEHGIGLQILNLGIDTRTPAGRLVFTIVAAVAAMERELLIERTQSGLAAARARGRVGGRRRSFTAAQQHEAQRLYDLRAMTMDQIAAAVGSSPSTVYRYLTLDDRHQAAGSGAGL